MRKNDNLIAPSGDMYLSTEFEPSALPPFLRKAISTVDQPILQDMLLLSTLTVCSYAMPHMKMLHGDPQHTYYPHLMTMVVAPPASGKGVMNNARLLLKPIDDRLRKEGKMAEIPANSSSASFLDIFKLCDGQGFVMATEMDNLSKIWKKDYGDYSDLFRQAYEHESYSKARRADRKRSRMLRFEEPKLSVLLSGTPNQLSPLLGTGEDGLASRFLPYIVTEMQPFNPKVLMHGDHYTEDGARAVFSQLGEELLARWQWLNSQDHDCLWSLTDEQAERLAEYLVDMETLVNDMPLSEAAIPIPISFRSMFNRLPVTLKRIGLVLSTLRLELPSSPAPQVESSPSKSGIRQLVDKVLGKDKQVPSSELTDASNHPLPGFPEVLYCSDEDFRTLLIIGDKLLRHLLDLSMVLPAPANPLLIGPTEHPTPPRAEELLGLLPEKFTFSEAIKTGHQYGVSRATCGRYLSILCEQKSIVSVSRGKYQKIV